MKKYIFFTVLSFFISLHNAQALDCTQGPSCKDLGYVLADDSAESLRYVNKCVDGKILRCPFDLNYVYCNKYNYSKCSIGNYYISFAKQCSSSCDGSEGFDCNYIVGGRDGNNCFISKNTITTKITYTSFPANNNMNVKLAKNDCKNSFDSGISGSVMKPLEFAQLYQSGKLTIADGIDYIYTELNGTARWFDLEFGTFISGDPAMNKTYSLSCKATVECEGGSQISNKTSKDLTCIPSTFYPAITPADENDISCWGDQRSGDDDYDYLILPPDNIFSKETYRMKWVQTVQSTTGSSSSEILDKANATCADQVTVVLGERMIPTTEQFKLYLRKKCKMGEFANLNLSGYYITADKDCFLGSNFSCADGVLSQGNMTCGWISLNGNALTAKFFCAQEDASAANLPITPPLIIP